MHVAEEWSITALAAMSGLTSRALRHYDALGLLPADRAGSGGKRYYGEASVLRLQSILLLRELGLGLAEIAEVVDEEKDAVTALRGHLVKLLAERERFDQLAKTVANTLAHLEGTTPMNPAELFEGLDPVKQAQYETELVDRHGKKVMEHITESKRRMAGWDTSRTQRIGAEYEAIEDAAVELVRAGVPPTDARALELMGRQFEAVSAFWTPGRASFTGLGQTYVDHPDFKARYDAKHPALAEFLRDAIAVYAQQHLG
ncbi:TipAS antibiotic-recognition domain-containing protein [Streptomyces sp. NBC_01218]|uniref:MerR family transcriptional regulator n=1 Tax=unclassified Streptomyces TaxID=2593676 RepID=UPI002E0DEDAB|nr:TipAS antibiotic-recognition domain-containing protein [Streptomyces sp. NBC_01218]WSQ55127.1 TipAS antibiotic-recognition domain-containing protein [Streptomyces sp. NBC_01218]